MSALKLTLTGIFCSATVVVVLEVLVFKFISHKLKTQSTNHQLKNEEGFVSYRRVVAKKQSDYKGSIFIFPPTGGENIIDRLYANDLAISGFEVFILQKWTGYEIEGYKYELHNVFYGSAQKALHQLFKLASTSRFGILGTSVGALHTSVSLTTIPEIKAGFMIVGGLPIPEIIITTNQPAMIDLKAKRYSKYNLVDDEQYLNELNGIFKFEPTAQPVNHALGKPIHTIISKNDDLVPYKNQLLASKFFQAQKITESSLNHTRTVMYYGFFKRADVTNFFLQHL